MQKLIVHDLSPEFDTLELYPLLDLHIGDKKTDEKLFESFLKYIKAQPNRFVTIQGDMMNNATKNSVSNSYEERRSPHEQKKYLKHELKAIKDRILCIVPGNHEWRSTRDVDDHPLYDVADALSLEHLYNPDGAFIKVSFGKKANKKKTTYTIGCIHGKGGGKKSGGAVNNIEDYLYSVEGLDILIMGHVHRKMAGKPSKLVIDPRNNNVTQKDVLWVIAAPWQDYGGYAFRSMLRPTTKGKTPIKLYGDHKEMVAEI